MSSLFKKAHKTHALAQPAGVPYPHPTAGAAAGSQGSPADERLIQQFSELRALVTDDTERARLLGVSDQIDAAWQQGKALPLLRARRKVLERALRGLD